MSEALEVLQDVLDRLSPIHVVMAKGLTPKAVEQLRDDLVFVEERLAGVEDEIEKYEYAERIAAAGRIAARADEKDASP